MNGFVSKSCRCCFALARQILWVRWICFEGSEPRPEENATCTSQKAAIIPLSFLLASLRSVAKPQTRAMLASRAPCDGSCTTVAVSPASFRSPPTMPLQAAAPRGRELCLERALKG